MKKTILGLIALFTIASSCSEKSMPEGKNIEISADFAAKTSTFAFDFWKAYDKEYNESYFLSPLSLNIALGMLLNGTDGETKAEIQKMLGFSDSEMTEINATYKELITKLPYIDPNVKNIAANSVWYDKDFKVKTSYLKDLEESFMAKVYGEDFGNPATVNKINQWASDNTNAKIKKILDKIEPDQVLFLLNALYFKGDWATQFDVKSTRKSTFYGAKKNAEVDFMNNLGTYAYASNGEFQMLEMPYGNEKYSFITIIPTSGDVRSLIKNMNTEKWKNAVQSLNKTKVEVSIPKFKIETSKNLNAVLKNLGMKQAFTSVANLSKIAEDSRLAVSFVKQDTYLSIDEKGSEAAAVTSIGVETTNMPSYPTFVANKPFAFAIVEKSSKTIQFIGKISDL